MANSTVIEIHFDINDHKLLLETFVGTSNGLEKVIEGFCDKFFEVPPGIQIFVIPPEQGSFLKKVVTVVTTAGAMYVGKPFLNGALKGITGNSLKYYQEKVEDKTELFVKDLVKGFLTKSNDQLSLNGVNIKDFPKAFHGRSSFYRACLINKDIKGLGFDHSNIFPIKKSEFCNYIADDFNKKLPPIKKLHKLAIVSAVTKKRKKIKSKWRAEDLRNGNLLDFILKDESFQKRFFDGEFSLKNRKDDDIITGLFEYEVIEINGEEKVTGSVLLTMVFIFNDKKIFDIPNGLKIEPVERFEKANNKKLPKNKSEFDQNNPSLFPELNVVK